MSRKKRKKRNRRLAKAYFRRGAMGVAKDAYERRKNPKKYKRKQRIRRYTEDGKITKKEAKKLQKRGISEREVQRVYNQDFKTAQFSFNKRPAIVKQRSPGKKGPSYTPLTISRGAGRRFDKGRPTSSKKSKSKSSSYRSSSSRSKSRDRDYDSGYNDQIGSLMEQLRIQQEAFDQRYGQQQADFQKQQMGFQNMFGQYQQQAAAQAAAAEQRYQDMMLAQQQAAAQAAAEREERARQDAISRQTMIANQMRASAAMPQLKIGAPDSTGIGGTSDFKRRIMQGMTLGGINV